jgi:NAD(P)-dependent dehydrogenase (short-subunit alcohol dehydrogenase family)
VRSLRELLDLHGRVAVVTGGAGHMGRAIAGGLAELGAACALVDQAVEGAEEAAETLQSAHGVETLVIAADLEDEAAVRAIPGAVAARFGRLDVLVNNAAFVGTSALEGWGVPFGEQRADTWRRATEVNLTAPFVLVQAAEALLRASGHGSIINVASIYGVVGPQWALYQGTQLGNPAAYAASKGGLLQLTRWLATTLAPEVRVNALTPGGIARGQDPTFVDRYVVRTPLGRMGTEEDLKGAAAFLAGDASAWVTGQNLVVDGGWTAW